MIYFFQDTVTFEIKIGYTGKPTHHERLRALQTGNPHMLVCLATMPGQQSDEDRLHRQFDEYKKVGEWFSPSQGVLEAVFQARLRSVLPTVAAPASLDDKDQFTFYLAGKISKNDWRHTIVEGMTDTTSFPTNLSDLDWTPDRNAILGRHHYAGPFFMDGKHYPKHGSDSHGLKANMTRHIAHLHSSNLQEACLDGCQKAIRSSDILFAWIDQLDCYGTIAEIGYARALDKMIWIAGPGEFRDMWFVYQMATPGFLLTDPSLLDAPTPAAAFLRLYHLLAISRCPYVVEEPVA